MGLVFTPAISVATSDVEPRYAGVAAATANTATQIGGSVGTAVLNSVAVAATASYAVAARPVEHRAGARLRHGHRLVGGCPRLGAVVVVLCVRTPRPTKED